MFHPWRDGSNDFGCTWLKSRTGNEHLFPFHFCIFATAAYRCVRSMNNSSKLSIYIPIIYIKIKYYSLVSLKLENGSIDLNRFVIEGLKVEIEHVVCRGSNEH